MNLAMTAVLAESKAAKEAGLGERVNALSDRCVALGYQSIEQYEDHFVLGLLGLSRPWAWWLYTERSICVVSSHLSRLEVRAREEERAHVVESKYRPQFEELVPRARAIGLEVFLGGPGRFGVHIGTWWGPFYEASEDGLRALISEIKRLEAAQSK